MIVVIPIQSQKTLSDSIIRSYDNQSVPVSIVTIGTPQIIDSRARHCETKSRQACSNFATGLDCELICMSDSDCLQLEKTNIEEAETAIRQDSKLGGVAFSQFNTDNLNQDHIDIKSFVIKRSLLVNIDWNLIEGKNCLCFNVKKHIEKNGLKFIYLDNKKRIDSI
jgi:hypothetical protein